MATQATLFVDSVTCRDEMGGSFREHFGNDEIYLGAIGIDSAGTATKIPFFQIYANFDDGDVKNFSPPRSVATLGLSSDAPASCRAILLLADKQHGGMNDALSKAHAETETSLAQKLAEGVSIAAGVPEVALKLGSWLISESKDKVFPPMVVGIEPSPGIVEFRGHEGIYRLNYHWDIA